MNEKSEPKTEKLGFFEKRRRAAFRAGVARGMDPAVAAMRARLHQAAKGDGPIVFGPWLSEVGYEILYWIPFLNWAVKEYEIDAERVCVISRGGVSSWYGKLARRYEDIFKLMSPAEFKTLNDARYVQTGVQKHMLVSDFDRLVLERLGYGDGILIHPELMYNLFNGYWSGADPFSRFTDHAIFRMMKPPPHPVVKNLPENFAAVKFYSRPSLVMDEQSRRIIDDYTLALAESGPVVVLDTGLSADDHGDFEPPSHPNIISARDWMTPEDNLVTQSAIVSRAKEVHCTYGGFAYLPLLYGVPAESYYSIDKHFMKIHGRAAYWLAAKTKTALSVTHLSSAARLAETARSLREARAESAAVAAKARDIETGLSQRNEKLTEEVSSYAAKLLALRQHDAKTKEEIAALHKEREAARQEQERKTRAAAEKLDHERTKVEALTQDLRGAVMERDEILAERRRADEKIAAMRREISSLGGERPPSVDSLRKAWADATRRLSGATGAAPAFQEIADWSLLGESADAAIALLAQLPGAGDNIDALRADLVAASAAFAFHSDSDALRTRAALAALLLSAALRRQSHARSPAARIGAAALAGDATLLRGDLIADLLKAGEVNVACDLSDAALIWRGDAQFNAICAEALAMSGRLAAALLRLAAAIASEDPGSVLKSSNVARVFAAAVERGADGEKFLEALEMAAGLKGATDRLTPAYVKAVSESSAALLTRRLLQRARLEPAVPVDAAHDMNLPLVLISQVQRSGGTLLAQLLDHHPNLLTHPHELHIGFPNKWNWPMLDMAEEPAAWLEHLFERTTATFLSKTGYSKSDGNVFALKDKMPFPFSLATLVKEFDRRASGASSQRDCINAYLSAYHSAWKVERPKGEKKWHAAFCPRMLLHEESIAGFFTDYPDGKLISCIRDPFSWYASSMRHDAEYENVEHAIDLWRSSAQSAFRQLAARPDATYLVTYDALVENTRETMAGIAGFLGIEMTEGLLQPTYAGAPILPNSSYGIDQYGVHRNSLDARDRLNEAQKSYIRDAAGELYAQAVEIAAKSHERRDS